MFVGCINFTIHFIYSVKKAVYNSVIYSFQTTYIYIQVHIFNIRQVKKNKENYRYCNNYFYYACDIFIAYRGYKGIKKQF